MSDDKPQRFDRLSIEAHTPGRTKRDREDLELTAREELARSIRREVAQQLRAAAPWGVGIAIYDEPVRTKLAPSGWEARLSAQIGPHPVIPAGMACRFPDRDAFETFVRAREQGELKPEDAALFTCEADDCYELAEIREKFCAEHGRIEED